MKSKEEWVKVKRAVTDMDEGAMLAMASWIRNNFIIDENNNGDLKFIGVNEDRQKISYYDDGFLCQMFKEQNGT